DVVGPNARRKTEYGVVGLRHRLGFGLEALQHDKGTKNLLLAKERVWILVPHERWREEGAVGQVLTRDRRRKQHLVGSCASGFDAFGDLITGASIDQRADLRRRIQPGSHLERCK